MTTTWQQPEALVFANDRPSSIGADLYQWAIDAETLIRAQQARIAELERWQEDVRSNSALLAELQRANDRVAELESQLDAIGAGGVEPLRKQAAAPQAVQAAVPVAWRLTNTAFRKPRFEYHDTKESAEQRQADFNRSVDDGGLHNLTPLYAAPAHPSEGVPAQAAVPEGWKLAPIKVPDSAFAWVSGGYPACFKAWDKRDTAVVHERAQRAWEAILNGITAPAPAAVAGPDERAAFEQWLGIKPCGAAHDFGWAAWRARAALAANQPAAQGMDAEIQQAVEAERERICAAIKAEDDHCVDQGDYMLDSNDCIEIVRGKWVRPDYSLDAAQAKQGGAA